MEAEAVRRWSACARHCGRAVPPVAAVPQAGCVVSQYGHAGPDWTVFRHGYRAIDPIHHHHVRCAAGSVAVPQLVRGCGLLRFIPTRVGMAGGMLTPPFT